MNSRRFILHNFRLATRRPGFALVVALAAIVLITIIVLAFFSRAVLNRQVSFSSTNQIKSDMLARTAADIIVGEVRQEIVDYSSAPTDGYYLPLASTNMVPIKTGVTGADTNAGVYTIAKVAADGVKIDPGANGIALGSSIVVDAKSRNGRTQSQWFNAGPNLGSSGLPSWVYLSRSSGIVNSIGSGVTNPSSTNYVVGRFTYTVYNTGGLLDANIAGFSTNKISPATQGTKSSIAYADLTALGLTTAQINGLISWRNAATGVSSNLFDTWATGINTNTSAVSKAAAEIATWGHLDALPGDNVFFSRRDLLRYLTANSMTNAAPNLGHFSRFVEAPTWSPVNIAGSTVAYGTKANDLTSANRAILNVKAFDAKVWNYADNGTREEVKVYESDLLLWERFSLAKLAWIGSNGPNAAAFASELTSAQRDDAILDCFGLKWSDSQKRWSYDHGDAHNILTLEEVRGKGRMPDFFELLKAGILSGSLGGSPGLPVASGALVENGVPGTLGNVAEYSVERDRHILQIGANIIDQADVDNYPTAIYQEKISGYPEDDLYNCVFGVENLPVLTRVGVINVFWPDHSGFLTQTTDVYGTDDTKVFIQPEVWNPHDSATANPATNPTPTQLRVVTYGACGFLYAEGADGFPSLSNVPGTPVVMNFGNNPAAPQVNGTICFKNPIPTSTSPPSFFDHPVQLTGPYTAADDYLDTTGTSGPDNRFKPGATKALWDENVDKNPFLAIYIGKVTRTVPPKGTTNGHHQVRVVPDLPSGGYLTFALEYKGPDGTWRPYSVIARVTNFYLQNWSSNSRFGGVGFSSVGGRVDPRTDRFSISASSIRSGNNITWNGSSSVRSVAAAWLEAPSTPGPGRSVIFSAWPQSANFTHTLPTAKNYTFDAWSQNLPLSDFRYSDPDAITRPADAWRARFPTLANGVTDTSGDGMQLYHLRDKSNTPIFPNSVTRRRPMILNRPFRSVAELGYAFRDQPWKTLDMWSQNSADAALLDLFSVSKTETSYVAGKVNLNTAPPKVLEALMRRGTKQVNDLSRETTADEAAVAAQVITAGVTTNTLANPADMVQKLAGPFYDALSSIPTNSTATNQPYRNKIYGETPIRSLSGVVNFRTWNFLIDVSAQSGRLAANASGLQDFIVEGEKRYWLHLAVDRVTGEIVDSKYEPVYE